MKITGLTTRLIGIEAGDWYGEAPPPKGESRVWEFPLTTITTDEGIDGHTMAYGKQMEGRAIAALLRDIYLPRLVDEDPLYSEAIWQKLKHKTRDLRNVTHAVLGMIDVALWDIKGKVAGLPLGALLGLRRAHVPSYATASRFLFTPEQVFEEAQTAKAAGYRGYKLQLWDGPARDIPRLRAAREAVGPDFPLMHDVVAGYNFTQALQVGKVLETLNYTWFEEPISDKQIWLLKRLADELTVPILATEDAEVDELPEYLRLDAIDIARGDVHHKGGVTGLRKALALCELFGINLEIHTASTPLLDVANLHVACAVDNCEFMESHQAVFRFGLKGRPLDIDAQGCLHLPPGPGLGVELDWDWLDNHTLAVL
jgi:L-alanine-DL-glutamate epimerase-like enolase superfamily enzyme